MFSEEEIGVVEKKENGLHLVRYYDSCSPSCESPTVYEIREASTGDILWSSGITRLDGSENGIEVSAGIRENAEKEFKERCEDRVLARDEE